jgi:hypothetical protein
VAGGGESTFRIILRAVDQVSGPISRVAAVVSAANARINSVQAGGRAFAQATGLDVLGRASGKVIHGLNEIGERATHMGRHLAHGFLAGAVGGGLLVEALHKLSGWGDNTLKTAQMYGLQTDTLQAWRFQAGQAGIATESLDTALAQFSKRASEARRGEGDSATFFQALGINLEDSKGRLKSLENLLPETLDAIRARIKSGSMSEMEVAKALFGRGGTDMTKFFKGGGEGLRAALDELRARGGLVDKKTLQDAEHFDDDLKALGASARGLGAALLGPLFHPLTKIINKVSYWIGANKELISGRFLAWVERGGALLHGLAAGIGEVITFVRRLIPDLGQGALSLEDWERIGRALSLVFGVLLAGAITHLTKKMWLLTAALAKSLVTWVVVGIWLLVQAIQHWDAISKAALNTWNKWWPVITGFAGILVYLFAPALGAAAAAAAVLAVAIWSWAWPLLAVGAVIAATIAVWTHLDDIIATSKQIWAEWGNAIIVAMGAGAFIALLVSGPIALLIGAAALIMNNWSDFKAWWDGLWEGIVAGWNEDTLWGAGEALIKGLWGGMLSIWDRVAKWWDAKKQWLASVLPESWSKSMGLTPPPAGAPSGTGATGPGGDQAQAATQSRRISPADALPGRARQEGRVVVDFRNAPPGTRITEQSAEGMDLELGMEFGPTVLGGVFQ